jgi:hypothetical protein
LAAITPKMAAITSSQPFIDLSKILIKLPKAFIVAKFSTIKPPKSAIVPKSDAIKPFQSPTTTRCPQNSKNRPSPT